MKIDGKITILIHQDKTIIEVADKNSAVQFLEVEMTPVEFQQALSRLAHVPCKLTVKNLSVVGKKMEHKRFEYEIPEGIKQSDNKALQEHCQSLLTDGWKDGGYYGSKDSFFTKNGKKYASAIVRRWV